MKKFEEKALGKAMELLSQHLGTEVDKLKPKLQLHQRAVDATVVADGVTFALEFSHKATSESVLNKVHQLKQYLTDVIGAVVPLLVVPYMGEAGSALCRKEGLSWLDLSGNAEIKAEGLTVKVSGRPNQYKRRGRPQNLFAAQNSRVTRWLLINKPSTFTHSDVVEQTKLDRGYTTRILRRMAAEGYIRRNADRSYRLTDTQRLMRDWYMSSNFSKHDIVAGSCFSKGGPMLVMELAKLLDESETRYAFTGLPAAWLYTKNVSFNLTTLYVDAEVNKSLMDHLGFHQEPRGANTCLVQPDDEGVFYGARLVEGVRCVHPLQVYVDLKDQPERATEATDALTMLDEVNLMVNDLI